MKDTPAFESRRVRSQPRTVTRVPVGILPFNTDATSTWSAVSMFRSYDYPSRVGAGFYPSRRGRRQTAHGVSLDLVHESWNDFSGVPQEPRRLRGNARARPAI